VHGRDPEQRAGPQRERVRVGGELRCELGQLSEGSIEQRERSLGSPSTSASPRRSSASACS